MKYAVTILLLAAIQTAPHATRKAVNANTTTSANIKGQGQDNKATTLPTSIQSKNQEDAKRSGIFTGLLVLVGFLTCGVIAWQSWETRKSANAAKASAEAAQRNVNIFISKERARVGFELLPVDLGEMKVAGVASAPKMMARYGVAYKVTYFGATPAFDVEGIITARIFESDKTVIPSEERYTGFMYLPRTISSQADLKCVYGIHLWRDQLMRPSDADIESIEKGTSTIHVYGMIRYKDLFDSVRQTPFHYRWEKTFALLGDTDFGEWVKFGPEEENDQT